MPEVGNRLSRSLAALTLFFTGQIRVAIDLVHLHVSFAHTFTRFVDNLRRRCQCTCSAGHRT
jgi:hypothetical protein